MEQSHFLIDFIMTFAKKSIDNLIAQQVKSWACATTQDAEKELLQELMKRDLLHSIEEGEEDFKNGKFCIMNTETNA